MGATRSPFNVASQPVLLVPYKELLVRLQRTEPEVNEKALDDLGSKAWGILQAETASQHRKDMPDWVKVTIPRKHAQNNTAAGRHNELHTAVHLPH